MGIASIATADERSSRLLTTDEAAALVGAKPQTLSIWRCTARHDLPFVRVGRLVRYREKDVLDWLERHTVRPEAI